MKYLLLLVIIAAAVSSAYAVRCYQCDSLSNPRCGNEFHAEDVFKLDCDRVAPPRFLQTFLPIRNATGCMKKSLDNVAGHPQVIRTCYFGDIHNTQTGCQSDPSLPFVKELSCDVCTGDLCNSSTAFGPLLFLTLLAGALACFY